MEFIVEPTIEQYAQDQSDPAQALAQELWDKTHADVDLPQMLVGPLEGAFLRMMVRLSGAKRVLEIGTFTGYSALYMAEGLPEDGELITCDVNEKTTALAKEFWSRSEHGKKIQSRLGPALETIAQLEGAFDLVFMDADKGNYSNYYEAVIPKMKSGGVILADNVLWSGKVLQPEEDSDKALAAFNAKVLADPRVENVLVTLRDGVNVIRKR
jgi:caffeoyl-CoA O-methyltransferase